jgi:hypothetical protein
LILFSDISGTLYLQNDPEQTKRNLMAVDRWRGAGNLFIVATSFSIDTVRDLIPDDDLADCETDELAPSLQDTTKCDIIE